VRSARCGLQLPASDWCNGPAVHCHVLLGFLRWISPATWCSCGSLCIALDFDTLNLLYVLELSDPEIRHYQTRMFDTERTATLEAMTSVALVGGDFKISYYYHYKICKMHLQHGAIRESTAYSHFHMLFLTTCLGFIYFSASTWDVPKCILGTGSYISLASNKNQYTASQEAKKKNSRTLPKASIVEEKTNIAETYNSTLCHSCNKYKEFSTLSICPTRSLHIGRLARFLNVTLTLSMPRKCDFD
jgi:hypothetical protein